MKIVFWGGNASRTGTTSNMLLMALSTAQMYQYKTLLMQCRHSLRPMEDALTAGKHQNRIQEEYSYFHNMGMDYLIQKSKMGELDEETMEQVFVPVWKDRIFYVPSSEKINKEVFEKNLLFHIRTITSMADRSADFTYFDAGSSKGALTDKIMEEADLIVVTFPQNPEVLDLFFSERHLNQEKMFYLIGNYDYNSSYNVKNIRRIYRIPKTKIGVVPYNVRFQNACYQGKLTRFVKNSLRCKELDGNYYFVKEVLDSGRKILDAARMGNVVSSLAKNADGF